MSGEIDATVTAQIGEVEYTYPHVRADGVHLWPPRPQERVVYAPWPAPYWRWGPGGWMGGIVVHTHPRR